MPFVRFKNFFICLLLSIYLKAHKLLFINYQPGTTSGLGTQENVC